MKPAISLVQIQKALTQGYIIASGANGDFEYLAPGNTGESLRVNSSGNLEYAVPVQVGMASQGLLSFDVQTGEINITALAVSNAEVDDSSASLAAFVSDSYVNGDEFQKSDTVFLTVPGEAWMHNGGTAGTVADFSKLTTPGTSDAAVRALFSGVSGVAYNPTTGIISGVVSTTAGNDLSINANGFYVNVSSSGVVDTSNTVAGSSGGNTVVSLQSLLDSIALILAGQASIASGTLNGTSLLWDDDGGLWKEVIWVEEGFSVGLPYSNVSLGATTQVLGVTPISSARSAVYFNGIKQSFSGILNDTLTFPAALKDQDVVDVGYYIFSV